MFTLTTVTCPLQASPEEVFTQCYLKTLYSTMLKLKSTTNKTEKQTFLALYLSIKINVCPTNLTFPIYQRESQKTCSDVFAYERN